MNGLREAGYLFEWVWAGMDGLAKHAGWAWVGWLIFQVLGVAFSRPNSFLVQAGLTISSYNCYTCNNHYISNLIIHRLGLFKGDRLSFCTQYGQCSE